MLLVLTTFVVSLLVFFNSVSAQTNMIVYVPELAKVRVGPGTFYDQLGELTQGQSTAAIGRSEYNDWIQVDFPSAPAGKGWVYANLVELRGGTVDQLPLVEAPPTATLPPTPQGDGPNPLLFTPVPTHLPTYTPAPAVTLPAYINTPPTAVGFPSATIIIGLFGLGLVGVVLAIIRRKA